MLLFFYFCFIDKFEPRCSPLPSPLCSKFESLTATNK